MKPIEKTNAINQIATKIVSVPIADDFEADLTEWLLVLGRQHSLKYLLAHADDGVIWGIIEDEILKLSGDVFPNISPALQTGTLQQARLFGDTAELLLWAVNGAWQARLIQDGTGKQTDYYDEKQILWGNTVKDPAKDKKNGFTLVTDGVMGHRHAVPKNCSLSSFTRYNKNKKKDEPYRPLRLKVRHYLSPTPATPDTPDTDNGQMVVSLSRLVDLAEEATQ